MSLCFLKGPISLHEILQTTNQKFQPDLVKRSRLLQYRMFLQVFSHENSMVGSGFFLLVI